MSCIQNTTVLGSEEENSYGQQGCGDLVGSVSNSTRRKRSALKCECSRRPEARPLSFGIMHLGGHSHAYTSMATRDFSRATSRAYTVSRLLSLTSRTTTSLLRPLRFILFVLKIFLKLLFTRVVFLLGVRMLMKTKTRQSIFRCFPPTERKEGFVVCSCWSPSLHASPTVSKIEYFGDAIVCVLCLLSACFPSIGF